VAPFLFGANERIFLHFNGPTPVGELLPASSHPKHSSAEFLLAHIPTKEDDDTSRKQRTMKMMMGLRSLVATALLFGVAGADGAYRNEILVRTCILQTHVRGVLHAGKDLGSIDRMNRGVSWILDPGHFTRGSSLFTFLTCILHLRSAPTLSSTTTRVLFPTHTWEPTTCRTTLTGVT
jgi:hypothetical protein